MDKTRMKVVSFTTISFKMLSKTLKTTWTSMIISKMKWNILMMNKTGCWKHKMKRISIWSQIYSPIQRAILKRPSLFKKVSFSRRRKSNSKITKTKSTKTSNIIMKIKSIRKMNKTVNKTKIWLKIKTNISSKTKTIMSK